MNRFPLVTLVDRGFLHGVRTWQGQCLKIEAYSGGGRSRPAPSLRMFVVRRSRRSLPAAVLPGVKLVISPVKLFPLILHDARGAFATHIDPTQYSVRSGDSGVENPHTPDNRRLKHFQRWCDAELVAPRLAGAPNSPSPRLI